MDDLGVGSGVPAEQALDFGFKRLIDLSEKPLNPKDDDSHVLWKSDTVSLDSATDENGTERRDWLFSKAQDLEMKVKDLIGMIDKEMERELKKLRKTKEDTFAKIQKNLEAIEGAKVEAAETVLQSVPITENDTQVETKMNSSVEVEDISTCKHECLLFLKNNIWSTPRDLIHSTDNHYHLQLDLTGCPQENLMVEVNDGNILTLEATAQEETSDGGKLMKLMQRAYTLPRNVDRNGVQYWLDQPEGLLTIEVQKQPASSTPTESPSLTSQGGKADAEEEEDPTLEKETTFTEPEIRSPAELVAEEMRRADQRPCMLTFHVSKDGLCEKIADNNDASKYEQATSSDIITASSPRDTCASQQTPARPNQVVADSRRPLSAITSVDCSCPYTETGGGTAEATLERSTDAASNNGALPDPRNAGAAQLLTSKPCLGHGRNHHHHRHGPVHALPSNNPSPTTPSAIWTVIPKQQSNQQMQHVTMQIDSPQPTSHAVTANLMDDDNVDEDPTTATTEKRMRKATTEFLEISQNVKISPDSPIASDTLNSSSLTRLQHGQRHGSTNGFEVHTFHSMGPEVAAVHSPSPRRITLAVHKSGHDTDQSKVSNEGLLADFSLGLDHDAKGAEALERLVQLKMKPPTPVRKALLTPILRREVKFAHSTNVVLLLARRDERLELVSCCLELLAKSWLTPSEYELWGSFRQSIHLAIHK